MNLQSLVIACPIYERGRRRGGLGGEVAKGRISRRKHLKGIFKQWNIKIFMLEKSSEVKK